MLLLGGATALSVSDDATETEVGDDRCSGKAVGFRSVIASVADRRVALFEGERGCIGAGGFGVLADAVRLGASSVRRSASCSSTDKSVRVVAPGLSVVFPDSDATSPA